MAVEVKIGGDNTVGVPITLADGTNFVLPVSAIVDALGAVATPLAIMPFNESSTVLAGAATFTGPARDSGVVSGGKSPYGYFNGFFFTDQTGTGSIEGSWDNATWTRVASAAVAVSTPLTLQIPILFRYHRVKLVNGATLQTVLQISSSYTAS